MLVRWPAHGPSPTPDVEALVQTLDSFWRFLRGRGRMASVSAEPKALVEEARRAAAGMREACADPARRSATTQPAGAARGERADDRPGAELPHDEDGNVSVADVGEVARQVRASGYVQQCRRLVQWVGDGRPVTSNQVLRLAPAREAYAELDLWEWERTQRRLDVGGHHLEDLSPETDQLLRTAATESFRSSADCRALDRLWLSCHEAALLEVGRTKAVAAWHEPTSDEEWRHLGAVLIGSLLVHLSPSHLHQVVGTLLHLIDPARDRVPLAELQDWWWDSPHNVYPGIEEHAGQPLRPDSDRWFLAALHELDDTGVWRHEGPELQGTALGHDVTLLAIHLLEEGILGS